MRPGLPCFYFNAGSYEETPLYRERLCTEKKSCTIIRIFVNF